MRLLFVLLLCFVSVTTLHAQDRLAVSIDEAEAQRYQFTDRTVPFSAKKALDHIRSWPGS